MLFVCPNCGETARVLLQERGIMEIGAPVVCPACVSNARVQDQHKQYAEVTGMDYDQLRRGFVASWQGVYDRDKGVARGKDNC
jgi:hypothetical protein